VPKRSLKKQASASVARARFLNQNFVLELLKPKLS
jgi:hypothetical protein